MYDKNGFLIIKGATVIVPDPNSSDIHNHGFVGQVDSFRGRNVVVIDGESECFEIEPERLEVQDEE